MSVLTQKQVESIEKALIRGVKDLVIAKRLGIPHKLIAKYRKECGITHDLVTEWRLEEWKAMIYAGHTLEHIASLYGNKPNSVKLMLWHSERFSFREAKRLAAEGRLKMQMSAAGDPSHFEW